MLPLLAACFAAGAASVASPCVLPLVPVYLAAAASARGRRAPAARMPAEAWFVAGFVVVFLLLGASSGGLASLLPAPTQSRVAGLVLVAVGMVGLGLLPAPPADRVVPTRSAPGGPVVLGAVFALAATPCTTPLLGMGLAAAVAGGTAGKGGLLLAAYGAGLATAIAAVGGAVGRAAARAARTRADLLVRVAGAATAVLGVVLALGQEWRLNVAANHLLDAVLR